MSSDNDGPRGIWSDGSHMWVLEGDEAHIYGYPMPPNIRLVLDPAVITEEGGRQTVRATVLLGGLSSAPSGAAASLELAHGTTDDEDFNTATMRPDTIFWVNFDGSAH